MATNVIGRQLYDINNQDYFSDPYWKSAKPQEYTDYELARTLFLRGAKDSSIPNVQKHLNMFGTVSKSAPAQKQIIPQQPSGGVSPYVEAIPFAKSVMEPFRGGGIRGGVKAAGRELAQGAKTAYGALKTAWFGNNVPAPRPQIAQPIQSDGFTKDANGRIVPPASMGVAQITQGEIDAARNIPPVPRPTETMTPQQKYKSQAERFANVQRAGLAAQPQVLQTPMQVYNAKQEAFLSGARTKEDKARVAEQIRARRIAESPEGIKAAKEREAAQQKPMDVDSDGYIASLKEAATTGLKSPAMQTEFSKFMNSELADSAGRKMKRTEWAENVMNADTEFQSDLALIKDPLKQKQAIKAKLNDILFQEFSKSDIYAQFINSLS